MQSVQILLGGCPSFEDYYSVIDLKFTDAGTRGAKVWSSDGLKQHHWTVASAVHTAKATSSLVSIL